MIVADTLLEFPRQGFRRLLSGGAEPDLTGYLDPPGDPGLFGPESATWVVHADLAQLVGGLRALLVQMLHPLAMAGVADHSDYRTDPWGRLNRTGAFVAATTFGSTASAETAIESVRRVHTRVRGVAPDGRPYRADDPHLLGWVHVVEVDSFLRAHQRYGRQPLDAGRADAYVAEMAEVAVRLGVPSPPRSTAELRATLGDYRGELAVGAQARDAVRFLLNPPLPIAARPAYGVIAAAAIGLLPGFARRQLWLPMPPLADPTVVRPMARALLVATRSMLGTSPAAQAARSRTSPER
jgi:uncharacterized protein (DUF2236 family)